MANQNVRQNEGQNQASELEAARKEIERLRRRVAELELQLGYRCGGVVPAEVER